MQVVIFSQKERNKCVCVMRLGEVNSFGRSVRWIGRKADSGTVFRVRDTMLSCLVGPVVDSNAGGMIGLARRIMRERDVEVNV